MKKLIDVEFDFEQINTKRILVNSTYIFYTGSNTECEVPYSELAMHTKDAGRLDMYIILTNGTYCYICFENGDTTHGLVVELIPQIFREKIDKIVEKHKKILQIPEIWNKCINDFYETCNMLRIQLLRERTK